jgi:DNA-binding NtrC family response regulator
VEAAILVVDDEPAILDFIESVLRPAGYRVLRAGGGWSAIEAYESFGGPVNLLLTDVTMPDLTGPVLAERLRIRQPDLQVLFISGNHDAGMMQRFVTQKGFALLPKPFTVDGLLRAVSGAITPAKCVA